MPVLRDGLLTAGGVLVVTSISLFLLYRSAVEGKRQEAYEDMRRQGAYLAHMAARANHRDFSAQSPSSSPSWAALRQRFQNVRHFYPEIDRLFTARIFGDRAQVILGTKKLLFSEDDQDPSTGEFAFPADSHDLSALKTGKVVVTETPFLREKEGFLGVFAPVGPPGAASLDILYFDVPAAVVFQPLKTVWTAYVTAQGVAVILSVLAGGLVALLRFREMGLQRDYEKASRMNEHRLATATRAGRVGTWEYNLATKTFSWNDVSLELFGRGPHNPPPTREELRRMVHPDDLSLLGKHFRAGLRTGSPFSVEFRLIRPDGQILHLKSDAIFLRDDAGRPTHAIGTQIDITPQKQAAKQAQAADQAKTEFLTMMSHEIRTPMNGVLGFTSLLKSTPLNPIQRDYVDTIETSGEALLELINQILDLSKIESGQIGVEQTAFPLEPFVREIFRLHEPRALQKKLEYTYEISPAAPKVLYTDRARLRQILTNLLGNAVKFTSQGFVHLKVALTASGDGRSGWSFVVSDSGPGIAPSALKDIFEPYYQVDDRENRKENGTGLGLAISRRLARLLGGDIHVESTVGQGSEFRVTIPGGSPPAWTDPAKSLPFPSSRALPACFQGKKILIVEDNPINRRLCAQQLSRLGFETEIAETGRQAIAKTQRTYFDAILMDVHLPEVDGLTATREIRKWENSPERPIEKRHRIIAVTALAMPEDRVRCLEAGMDDYLSKPISFNQLADVLAKWITN